MRRPDKTSYLVEFVKKLTKEEREKFFLRYLQWFARAKRLGRIRDRGDVYYGPEQNTFRKPISQKGRYRRRIVNRCSVDEACIGADYTPEQIKFMLAMDREQGRLGRKLKDAEVLRVAKSIGYYQGEIPER